jgi:uncharacterized protein (TIGR00251 family)
LEELVKVCVKPNSPVSKVLGYEEDCLVVRVAAPPEGGKANKELTKLLKKYFKAKKVEIVKGHTSRTKLVRVIK